MRADAPSAKEQQRLFFPLRPRIPVPKRAIRGKKKRKKKSLAVIAAERAIATDAIDEVPATEEQTWTMVVKRGAKSRAARIVPLTKATPAKLKAPRSSTIVLTLQLKAISEGDDYKRVVSVATAGLEIPYL